MSLTSELNELINIRNYVCSAINNYSLSRTSVSELNVMNILLDKLIIEKLLSKEFKEYVRFEDKDKAVAEVRKITDIKSGLKQ